MRQRLLLLTVLLLPHAGCKPSSDDEATSPLEQLQDDTVTGVVHPPADLPNDLDGDGYTLEQGDCNDADASMRPDALEVCDGIDNNCSGQVDEGISCTVCSALLCTNPNTMSVTRYEWKAEEVYYVSMGCCDMYNQVFSQSCRLLCAPDGGFSGAGDGECPTFFSEATELGTVCSH